MLDLLFRNWLRNAARQRVYDAARQAAFEHLSQAAQETAGPAPEPSHPERPCDVGLIFGQGLEAGAFEDRLDGVLATQAGGLKFCQGGLRGRHVVCVASGTAAAASGQAAELLAAGHRPQWIISAGSASGLQSQLQRGDFLLANEVCNLQGQSLAIDLHLPADQRSPRVHAGKLLSLDKLVRRVDEKQTLSAVGAMAADTDSFAVAQVCQREKTRFLAVRIIRDALHEELPREIERIGRAKSGAARWGAAIGALVQRPSSAKDMLDIQERALLNADRLAKFLEGVIVQLSPLESHPRNDVRAEGSEPR
jgi:adenosylhomocysteine nucleosidase